MSYAPKHSTPFQPGNHCGYVAICGRPNVGKSTLLNAILAQKLSITSPKPQTTRHRILGVKTRDSFQALYVDTPGLHRKGKRLLNQRMNRQAYTTIYDVDVIIFVIEALLWHKDDDWILHRLQETKRPIILAINKVDTVKDKTSLLPFMQNIQKKHDFIAQIPLTARRKNETVRLETLVESCLPPNEHAFASDTLTDCSERFLATEIIREKLMRRLHHELPYALMVEIELFKQVSKTYHIDATVLVETEGQKAIVIGKGGEQLKEVGRRARRAMENLFAKKIHLTLWVKVKQGWPDSGHMLGRHGL